MYYEDVDEWELPKLIGLSVQITKSSTVEEDNQGRKIFSTEEERAFEYILIKATRQFVSAVKLQIGQWDLDIRHPVRWYNYKYIQDDLPDGASRPVSEGSGRMPESALRTISFETYGEVTAETWRTVGSEVRRPIQTPPYDELLYDATTFRRSYRYDTAALFAAIAIELMLEAGCKRSLKKQSQEDDQQWEAKLSGLRMPSLLRLIQQLNPRLPIDGAEIRRVFKLRNKIAHGEVLTVDWREMNEALHTAHSLRRDLKPVLE